MAEITQKQLARWYEAYGAELLLYARQLNPDQQAEDTVQEAFIKLLKQRRCPDSPRAWLFRVVRNDSINCRRKLRRQVQAEMKIQQTELMWFESKPNDLIDARLAQNILQTLPVNLREIVMLKIWGQMSLTEIAKLTNKSIPWIHKEYKKALELIRNKLEYSSCTKKKT